jgi:hypothetical protein
MAEARQNPGRGGPASVTGRRTEFRRGFMVFEKIAQPDSADDVARVVYSRRPAAEAARVNNSRHTCYG